MRYFDVHTHTQFAAFKTDGKEVVRRALEKSVFLVNVGTQKDTSKKAVELSKNYERGVYATVGLHPIHTGKSYYDKQELGSGKGFISKAEEFDYEYYRNLALDSKVVAIGECGLDYFRIKDLGLRIKEKQKQTFIQQIELACEVKKPLMLHCRDAFSDLIAILKANSSKLKAENPGIAHFFSGTKEDAKELLEMGFYFSFGGVITFARNYDALIKMIPLDRVLSETDAPYVAPVPYRSQRNEPIYVIEVVKKLAEIRGVALAKMREQIWINTKEICSI